MHARKEGDTAVNKLINIYGESNGFYYANVDGESTYRYMWKGNIEEQTWVRKSELRTSSSSSGYIPQGFAMDENYCYSFKVYGTQNAEETHELYQYNVNTGDTTKMTPIMYQGRTVGPLYHANDAAVVSFASGQKYIFVVAYSTSQQNYIVKLGVNSSGQYWEEARYPTLDKSKNNNQYFQIAGITLKSGEGTNSLVFLIKRGLFY